MSNFPYPSPAQLYVYRIANNNQIKQKGEEKVEENKKDYLNNFIFAVMNILFIDEIKLVFMTKYFPLLAYKSEQKNGLYFLNHSYCQYKTGSQQQPLNGK